MAILQLEHLKIIHYYYFFISVFSLFNAFILWFVSAEKSLAFLALCGLNFCVSIYTTWLSLEEMKKFMIIEYIKYIAYHFLLIITTAISTLVMWLIFSGIETILYNVFLTINLIVFIVGFSAYILGKTHILEIIIDHYRKFQFNRSRGAAIKKARKFKMSNTCIEMIRSLKYSSDKDISGALSRANLKDQDQAKRNLDDLKTFVAEKKIKHIEETVKKLEKEPLTPATIKTIEEYEEFKKKLIKESKK